MFRYMKICYTFFRHLEPQILSLVNKKNQPNEKKGFILFIALSEWIL